MKYLEKGNWRLYCSSEEVSQKDYEHSIVVTYKDDIIGTMSIFNKKKKNDAYYWMETYELYLSDKRVKMANSEWHDLIAELDKQKDTI